jgi:aldehyde:ferredoxin oxidoreductase
MDTYQTQQQLRARHGYGTEVVCIGPAGENLSRISVIQSGLDNAAGQGGFGAVMGSKKLKAIAVKGSGGVRVAHPETFRQECLSTHRLIEERIVSPSSPARTPSSQTKGCTMACTPRNCSIRIQRDEGGEVISTHCCSGFYLRFNPRSDALRAVALANRYGLNHWEMMLGYGGIEDSWFNLCKKAGVLTDEDFGIPFEPDNSGFWCEMIRKIAYREGIGDVLAEGVPRAADILGKGHEYLPHVAHGFETHWDGHLFDEGGEEGMPRFPYWLVSALMWATDSRDPLVHGYAQEITRQARRMPIEKMMEAAARIYGSEQAVDPRSGYAWKAWPTVWHQNRLAVKDSIPVCDQIFPLIFHASAEDGYADIEAEARLFSAATGSELSWAELDNIGARIYHLERAIMVREGRTRSVDEEAARFFYKTDPRGVAMDPEKFQAMLTEFYGLRGWDPDTGWPTRETMDKAGLQEVADALAL